MTFVGRLPAGAGFASAAFPDAGDRQVSARSGGVQLSVAGALFPRFCMGRIGLPVMPGEEGVSCTAPQMGVETELFGDK